MENPEKRAQGLPNIGKRQNVATKGKSWFFGIGINDYKEFSNLNNAVNDIKAVQQLLMEKYDVEDAKTIFDKEATRENIIDHLDTLVEEVQAEDKLIIYYSGHGHLNKKTDRGYWIPHNAKIGKTAHYLRNSTIREYIKDLKARHVLLISDSCFSGTLFVRGTKRSTAVLGELDAIPSRWAICSGRHDEEVYDGKPGENSPFTTSILEILSRNDKPTFNIAKLADRVVEQTRANYKQLPEGNPLYGVGHKGGQYVFYLKDDLKSQKATELWQKIEKAAEGTRLEVNNKLKLINQFIRKYDDQADYEKALDLGELLEYKKKFIDAKSSEFALRKFLRLKIPDVNGADNILEEAKQLLFDFEFPQIMGVEIDSESTFAVVNAKRDLPNMIFIQGGTFQMGDQFGYGYEDELPVHSVTLNDFYLSEHQVTFEEYAEYCNSEGISLPDDKNWEKNNRPVINVSWEDAVNYCNWKSEQSRLQKVYTVFDSNVKVNWNANGYRLPTEAEWEYAARSGGNKEKWAGTSTGSSLDKYANYGRNIGKTKVVGSYYPNELGLYDMSGNVWEWCWDLYNSNYYAKSKEVNNPTGPNTGFNRVSRGGGWDNTPWLCRSTCRGYSDPATRSYYLGFRLASSLR